MDRKLSLVLLHSLLMSHAMMKRLFLEEWHDPIEVYKAVEMWDYTLLDWKNEKIEKHKEVQKKLDKTKIESLLIEKNISIVEITDDTYPVSLRTLGHAPYFLYVRGILRSDMPLIGVVWSRKHTAYAERIIEKIIPDITSAWVGIVSGWATGVDSLAHEVAIRHGGYTLAVFGTGIDRCYPAGNKSLFESILTHGGGLISHFPLGTWPELYNFPIRNEIVAWVSKGVFIPEAGLSSGTLITAQLALEHGRDVFAVPGDIDRATSEGTNMLISTGQAKCVRSAWDLLEEYFDTTSLAAGMTPIIDTKPKPTNPEESRIYEAIIWWSHSVDELLRETGFDMTDLITHIAMLEIAWHIRMDEMGRYSLS